MRTLLLIVFAQAWATATAASASSQALRGEGLHYGVRGQLEGAQGEGAAQGAWEVGAGGKKRTLTLSLPENSSTTASPSPTSATTLYAAGGTFPAAAYTELVYLFAWDNPDLRVSYTQLGSTLGK